MLGNLQTPLNYSQKDWELRGFPLKEIAERYPTPFYLYDGERLLERYRMLLKSITLPRVSIFYAMKANYNPNLLKLLLDEGASVDTVSPGEVALALRCGFPAERILFTANNITDEEMMAVQQQGILFNIGSLSRLEKYGRAFPGSEVCLRFNPEIAAGEDAKIMTGGPKSKFGIPPQDMDRVWAIVKKYNLTVTGIHKHTGSGITDGDLFFRAVKNLLAVAGNFPDLRFIDIGGGYTVPYHPEAPAPDYTDLGNRISALMQDFFSRYGRITEVRLEPGKYLTAEAGYLIVQVNTLKESYGRLIAGTGSGFPQMLRTVLYGAYHHILNLSNPEGELKKYDVCGNICESGDLFAEGRMVPEIREGDYLAILNTGAYGFSMAGIYNLRPLPAEVLLYQGSHRMIRTALSSEQLAETIFTQYQ